MNIVIAMDSFKESITSINACNVIKKAFLEVCGEDCYITTIPMADGGEGTVSALVNATNGKIIKVKVLNPLFNEVDSYYGLLGDSKTAVIEMATASGLELISNKERNPMLTTTFGTGQLILHALDNEVDTIILGIGGSATNDGGVGMMSALGVKFLDESSNEIRPCGGELGKVRHIDMNNLDERIESVKFIVACDVTNPLIGEKGASNIFGRQKGATEEMIKILDKNLENFANIVFKCLGKEIKNIEGGGAAGGVGAGAFAFLNAELKKGIEIVIKYSQLEKYIKNADLVITGEGKIDAQTIYGKTPIGIAKLAKKYNKPVIGISGILGEGHEQVYSQGIDCTFAVTQKICSIDEAIKSGESNLYNMAINIAKLIKIDLSQRSCSKIIEPKKNEQKTSSL